MKDRIKRAFGDIRADDALLAKTAARLQEERAGRERKSHIRPLRLAGVLAAILALLVGVSGYHALYADAAAYVSIDVNPSLALTLNRMDRVIATAAYNADGETLLRQVNVRGKPYDDAAALLLCEMALQGYVEGDALVTMTVQAADGAKERGLCEALLQTVSSRLGTGRSSADVEVFPVTREVREAAHGCHISAAKYLAIQELMEVDDAATLEAYSGMALGQIRQRTRQCREQHESGASGNGNHGRGQGHGHQGRDQ